MHGATSLNRVRRDATRPNESQRAPTIFIADGQSKNCPVKWTRMDTIRVDISYRPLRIGWAIQAGDIGAFRSAVRLSYALWGGRFNPILIADHDEDVKRLVDLFRVDVIWPIGDTDTVKTLPKKFPYLINPVFFDDTLFVGSAGERKHAQVLDVHNTLVHFIDRPEWQRVKDRGVKLYTWQPDDPLADLFLVQFGGYPSAEETGTDYRAMLKQAADATEDVLAPEAIISARLSGHPSIPFVARLGLERHYSINARRDSPGFFVGDAASVDDLVCYWNLRAADIPLWFVDPNHLARYAEMIPAWEKTTLESVAHRHEWERRVAVWSRREDIEEVRRPFGNMEFVFSHVSEPLWNGLDVLAPMMHLGGASVLGVVGQEGGKIKVSFALNEKPFSSDTWFWQQHLVASVSFTGGLYGNEQHTLTPPYLPELNEFYARTMHFEYNKLRIEPGRVGLVIDAADHDSFLYALSVADLMERLFGMVGYEAKLSSGGLIVRQLIARLGGLQGARVFKIPGVRRLLRTHGLTDSFTKRGALQLIGGKDPDNPGTKFSDHENLYIEQRPGGIKLRPQAVFGYLVEKGLFRMGAELACPSCRMVSWIALDVLKQRVICELCGHEHDATRQLVDGEWHYRRSGVMGTERNAQGAVPVALTLQQLETNVRALERDIYSPSLNLVPKAGVDLPKCEIDFVWVIPRVRPPRTIVLLGECKDQGPIKLEEFEADVENLRRVADALPWRRFEAFIVLSKLAPFTPEEIERAKTLNHEYQRRVILLTARELEPYMMYERTKLEFKNIRGYGGTPEQLAQTTAEIYFRDPSK